MAKNADSPRLRRALIVIGWISFALGFLSENPLVKFPLLAIARVLP